jgi:hypothetical protein
MDNSDENKNLEDMFRDLIDKSLKNMEEERDLSLERYRRQDESIISPEDFVLQGKFAVDYLKVAADRSNAMISVAKMLKDIVYKEGTNSESMSSGGLNDAYKKEIFKYLQTGKSKPKQED